MSASLAPRSATARAVPPGAGSAGPPAVSVRRALGGVAARALASARGPVGLAIPTLWPGFGVEALIVEFCQAKALERLPKQSLDLAHDRLVFRHGQGQGLAGLIAPPAGRCQLAGDP